MDLEKRIVVLIDMDCFYCQVEEKLNPDLKGKPIAVVQYNPWKGGGIIAVNYVARARGVTRHMRGDEAREHCPEIELPSVPCQRGKADISKYRDAGKEVARVLQKYTSLLERASIDEAYLDITAVVQNRLNSTFVDSINTTMMSNTFALGYDTLDEFVCDVQGSTNDSIDFDYDNAKQLLVGAVIVSEIRAAVFEETGYTCSAGIAHNKILAKLVCGMNKPNKQTVLPKHSVSVLFESLAVRKVKHLGGKFGHTVCEILNIKNMIELQRFSERELQKKFDEKNGTWLYNIARGIDLEPVQARFNPKSIGCCKNFKGKAALLDLDSLRKWLKDLGDEIEDRLEQDAVENNRTPKQVVVSFSIQQPDGRDTSSSRSYNFVPDDELCSDLFYNKALELIMESTEGVKIKDDDVNKKLKAPIKFLGISVGKFEDNNENKKTRTIVDFFSAGSSKDIPASNQKENITQDITENQKTKKDYMKDFVLSKFFKATDKATDNTKETKQIVPSKDEAVSNQPVLESTLETQESFFAKFLKKGLNTDSENRNKTDVRSTTLLCNVVNCGDDSNDTIYSGSTINMEINKSIALFEDDPEDVDRVSSMRDLLNNSTLIDKEDAESLPVEEDPPDNINRNNPPASAMGSFECPDCKKLLPIYMKDIHADYHLALRLRDEERQQVRREKKDNINQSRNTHNNAPKTNKSVKEDSIKSATHTSIATFFKKLDSGAPTETCSECGKKVPLDKFSEHTDFHEAQKLNRELNKRPISIKTFTQSNVKRKRRSESPIKKLKVPCKSIDSFFR